MKKLNLNAIRIDGGTQSRVEINNEAVSDYAEAVKVGIEFPPVIVFHDGADHWLADGFHRFHAHKQAGKASIPADIRAGTVRDAILFSLGANCTHGLRRSNADKRKAVQTLLADPEWAEWSDSKIAQACGVDHKTVAAHRASILGNSQDASAVRSVERAGKKYRQDTSQIGKKTPGRSPITPQSAPPAPVQAPAVPPAAAPALAPDPAAEPEDFGPSESEIADAMRAQEDELNSLRKIADADDKLAAALAEVKRLTALNTVLESRIEGLMNEKNAAIRQAKSWQRKAEKAERAAKEAA